MEWFIVGKLADRRVCASTKPSRATVGNDRKRKQGGDSLSSHYWGDMLDRKGQGLNLQHIGITDQAVDKNR
jgi:hypothetical protein